MIFYFSGTGNSHYVAEKLATLLGDTTSSIPSELKCGSREYRLAEGEKLGFVFPVYAWGPPKIVLNFIENSTFTTQEKFTYAVCTCGDDDGRTMKLLEKGLNQKGISLDGAFSIQMPNNYILMYDVDPPDLQKQKLEKAEHRLEEIADAVKKNSSVFSCGFGRFSDLKTYVIHPLFLRFMVHDRKFWTTSDCNSCGKCMHVCPVENITIQKKPLWQGRCIGCLACIHLCPQKAIQYGKATQKKGRYFHKSQEEIQTQHTNTE